MMGNSNLNTLILEKLNSTQDSVIISALDTINNDGDVNYIPYIVICYENTSSNEVKKKITNLFNDIKNQKAAPIIVDQIKTVKSKQTLSMLLTSCWSSGICYADFLPEFIDIVIKHDYMTAFEALTVIDNMEGSFDIEMLKNYINKLKSAKFDESMDKKKPIVTELIIVLEQLVENS